MSFSSSAPVESITRSVPISNIFGIAGTLPVARMQWSNVSVSSSSGGEVAPFELQRRASRRRRPGVDHAHLAPLGELLEAAGERG